MAYKPTIKRGRSSSKDLDRGFSHNLVNFLYFYHHPFVVIYGIDDNYSTTEAAERYMHKSEKTDLPIDNKGGKSHFDRLRLFESIIANANDAILVTNAEPIDIPGPSIIYVNNAWTRMTGYTLPEVLDLSPRILLGVNTDRTQLDKIRIALSSWKPIIVELINYRKDGTEFWVELSIFPVADECGQYTHWVSIQREITERRLVEKMLGKSEMLNVMGELAAGVAHEIRNPLTSLRGFTQLFKFNPEANKKFLPLMISELDRIEYIVSDFLSLAKRSEDQFSRASLLSLIQNIVLLLDIHAIMNNVQIVLEVPDTLPLIYCEENRLKQVFLNVIKNGIESMESGGTLTIIGEHQNEEVLLKFIDQGCGIPPERIVNLGKPFNTTKEKGTGLGLMMCQQIIKSHSGQMHFESLINQGTTVFITLPI